MITQDDVKKIANLAKLNLNETELTRYTTELGNILGFVERLNQLDLKGVKATSHAVDVTNVFREDVAVTSIVMQDIATQAPAVEDNLFVVPKVI